MLPPAPPELSRRIRTARFAAPVQSSCKQRSSSALLHVVCSFCCRTTWKMLAMTRRQQIPEAVHTAYKQTYEHTYVCKCVFMYLNAYVYAYVCLSNCKAKISLHVDEIARHAYTHTCTCVWNNYICTHTYTCACMNLCTRRIFLTVLITVANKVKLSLMERINEHLYMLTNYIPIKNKKLITIR